MIIRTFNLTYFLLLFFILSACILITCLLRGKSEDIKRKVMYGLCYFNIILFKSLYFILPMLRNAKQ